VYAQHTPKVAGTSWLADLPAVLTPGGMKLYNSFAGFAGDEKCFAYKDTIAMQLASFKDPKAKGNVEGSTVMVRNPREHVFSQYKHCRTHWNHTVEFEEWVDCWLDFRYNANLSYKKNPVEQQPDVCFGCHYNPHNLQSQRMVCKNTSEYRDDEHLQHDAIQALKTAGFVGVSEAYQESLCLLTYVVQGKLPASCNCENKSAWESFNLSHIQHHTNELHLSIEDVPESVLHKVDSLTVHDNALHTAGVNRFLTQIHQVQQHTGIKIMCDDTLRTAWSPNGGSTQRRAASELFRQKARLAQA
jgi:hypothetical protein